MYNIKKESTICTDELKGYQYIEDYTHLKVNHSAKEFVNGMASVNGIESFWALLKRGYHGTYHNFSTKHLSRYVNEFVFRQNEGNCQTDTVDRIKALCMLSTREYYPNHPSVSLTSFTSIPNYDADKIRRSTKSAYTQLFIDLKDNHNQLDEIGGDRANDRVRGYTFSQIQQAVKKSRQLDQVRDYLIDNYNNGTQDNLEDLFDFYLQF